jgi:hypothetical protein
MRGEVRSRDQMAIFQSRTAHPIAAPGSRPSVNGSAGGTRIELDLAEGGFVVDHVLLQQRHESFGLLRAQINSLKIMQLDLRFRSLLHGAEDEKKIPYVNPNLYAVRVGLAIFGGLNELYIGLVLRVHVWQFTLLDAARAKPRREPGTPAELPPLRLEDTENTKGLSEKQGMPPFLSLVYFRCSNFTVAVMGWPSRITFTSTTSPTLLLRKASVKS